MTTHPAATETRSPTDTRTRRTRKPLVALVAVGVVLGLALGLALAPRTELDTTRTGDLSLAGDVEAVIGHRRGLGALSVGRLRDGDVSFAGLGSTGGAAPTPDTPYELGSITKTFTGMLLADAVERREVRLDDRLGSHLSELAGTPAGDATLRQLANHTSGLPTFPPAGVDRIVPLLLNDAPDTSWTTTRLIDAARTTPVEGRGTYAYSNLGMALLGHALARAAEVPGWATLAQQRLLTPLKMTRTQFLPSGAPEPDGLAQPHRGSGWPAHTWTSEGYQPAGVATRTTAADLMRFARAVVDGTAPGLGALDATTPAGDRLTVGLAWHAVRPQGGDEVLWHNGGTGGSSTMLVLDRKARAAVVVLGNTTREVDDLAIDTLIADRPGVTITPSTPDRPTVGLAVLAVSLVLLASQLARSLRSPDRVHLLTGLAEGVTGVALALIWGPWSWLPGWVLVPVVGLAGVATALGLRRLRGASVWPERRRALAVVGLVLTVGMLALVLLTA